MRKSTLIFLAILIALIILAVFQGRKISRLSTELDQQKQNVEILKGNERIYRICDSIKVAEIYALQLDRKQFDALVKAKDRELSQIKDARKKDLEYYTKLAKQDSCVIYRDKFIEVPYGNDSCLGYYDAYIEVTHCPDCTYIETHDTIKQVISAQYRHKFLWWKWGLEGFSQDVWSTNPHSRIHFEEFVKLND